MNKEFQVQKLQYGATKTEGFIRDIVSLYSKYSFCPGPSGLKKSKSKFLIKRIINFFIPYGNKIISICRWQIYSYLVTK